LNNYNEIIIFRNNLFNQTYCITMRKLFITMSCFLLAITLSAQSIDTSIVFDEFNRAEKFYQKAKYDSASLLYTHLIEVFTKPLEVDKDSVLWKRYIGCYSKMSYIKANQKNLEESTDFFNKSVALFINKWGSNNTRLIALYTDYVDVLRANTYDDKMIEMDLKTLEIIEKNKFSDITRYIQYVNTGLDYRQIGEHEKALEYLELAKSFYDSSIDTNKLRFLKISLNLAAVYNDKQEYSKAAIQIKKAISTFENIKQPQDLQLNVASKLYHAEGLNFWREKFYDKAIQSLNKAINIKQRFDTATISIRRDLNIGLSYHLLGRVYVSKRNFKIADEIFLKSIEVSKRDNLSHNWMNFNELSNSNYLQGDFTKAVMFSDSALKPFVFEINSTGYPLSIKPFTIPAGRNLIEVLAQRSDGFKLGFKQTKQQNYLAIADSLIQKTLDIKEDIANRTNNKENVNTLESSALAIYERALRIIDEQYTLSNNEKNLEKAFSFLEKTKSLQLRESLNKISAIKYSTISKTILQEEQLINTSITTIERKILEERQKLELKNEETLKILNNQLFNKKQEKEALITQIKKSYPSYYRTRFDNSSVDFSTFKTYLKPNQTVLNYFVGDTNIYILVINQKHTSLRVIPKDFSLDRWIDTFRIGADKEFKTRVRPFVNNAHNLYKKLIAPITDLLPKRDSGQIPPQLIIIPDDSLGYIPFEALITKPASNAIKFNQHHYLIQDYVISYNFSATAYVRMQQKKHLEEPTYSFVGLAPFSSDSINSTLAFNDRSIIKKDFGPLPSSGVEVDRLGSMTQGQVFKSNKASCDLFKLMAQHARIVHVSSHGIGNDSLSGLSYLIFAPSPNSNDNGILYSKDIYNLHLNADLVVLSACETGIGKLRRGEGVMGLSRAFAAAGAKSVVYSLWRANDAVTKNLMIDFYQIMLKGEGITKDEALWQAKINYISKEEIDAEKRHPFYWAPFVFVGDSDKLRIKNY
jgi:CHAT domain-containing protein